MPKPIELVAGILENYANRGTFKGFSRGTVRGGVARFKVLWHRDRFFDLILDTRARTLRIPVVLPSVPARSRMYRECREFVDSRHSPKLAEHRRIDRRKARAVASNRSGNVSIAMSIRGDYEYGTRKLIHLVHEVYLDFLYDGRYYEYLVETFDLDPDRL